MAGFFEKVHRLVSLIPPGQVTSYGQIAALLGQPRAARTVGWALHAVPEGSDIPWQRVVNIQGRITNTASIDSAEKQRALLEMEGIVFDEQGRIDMEVHGWPGPDFDELDDILR